MKDQPEVGGTEPVAVDAEEGKMYCWCSGGRSANQPFCDGVHKGTGFAREGWEASKTGKVFFCA